MAARIRSATPGISRSICLNSRWNITIRSIGEVATTLAVRRSVSISPISPKNSPGPSSAIRSPFFVTSAFPCSITKNSCANWPSVARRSPAGTEMASVHCASWPSSFLERPEKKPTPSSRFASIGRSCQAPRRRTNADSPAQARGDPLRQRLLEQQRGHERSGAAAEAWPGMRRRAHVPHARDRRPVRRAPEEVLVERERAAVRIALDEVHVRRPEVGGRQHSAREDRRLEIRDLLREARLDAVGVALPQLLRPCPVAGVELAGGVALDLPRELLQLDPEDPLPVRRTRGIDRQRLPDDDRGLRGQQPPLRLVHRPRDAVEAR